MIRRLYLRIYLTTLGSLAIVVILSALLWQFTAARASQAQQDRFIGALVGKALPPDADGAALKRALGGLVVPPIEGLTLFDRDGRRLGDAEQSGTGASADAHDVQMPRKASHPHAVTRTIRLDDGRVVVVRMHSDSIRIHLGGLALTFLIALAVALGTYPIVRRLTRRLEALAVTVDQFGQGDLGVRAPASGDDEVSRLSTSFNDMADRVAGLLGAHGRMLANASHELRSPLARIRVALELNADGKRADLVDGMRNDCSEIEAQIEEILLSSKLDTVDTALPAGTLDLQALVAEECARLDIPFETVPAEVRGDAHLLRRLIRNLLENARKYGGLGVDATLGIDASGQRILQVGDRGPGIPEGERERVFEPFYRPARSAETGTGWGLGLALVRQIADRHQGTVRCLGRIGGGCVFELALPAPGEADAGH